MSTLHPPNTHTVHEIALMPNIHYHRTNFGKRSLCYNGVQIWSKIPNDIKQITNTHHFKELSKQFIVQNIS